jgi:hypothetical protein
MRPESFSEMLSALKLVRHRAGTLFAPSTLIVIETAIRNAEGCTKCGKYSGGSNLCVECQKSALKKNARKKKKAPEAKSEIHNRETPSRSG